MLIGLLKALEFTTLMRRIAADIGADASAIEAVPIAVKGWPPGGEAAAVPAPDVEAAPAPPTGIFGRRMTPDEAVEQTLGRVRDQVRPSGLRDGDRARGARPLDRRHPRTGLLRPPRAGFLTPIP